MRQARGTSTSNLPDREKAGPSQTAQLAAAHRAYHRMHDRPILLDDSSAIWLLGPPLGVVLRVGLLRRLFWEKLLTKVRPISAFIVIRSRYTEDRLEAAIADGWRQYVILGAGLDSWALRHPDSEVNVFELDRPQTQEWKARRIRARLGALPPCLTLIPIDFEKAAIADVLCCQSYDRDAPVLVSWLGTTPYLTRPAIAKTLTSLAMACAPGSQVVFDYFLPKSAMSAGDLELYELLDHAVTERGEPMQTLLGADEMAELLEAAGFTVVEDLSASEIRLRYLSSRSDGLEIPGFVRICCAVIGGAQIGGAVLGAERRGAC